MDHLFAELTRDDAGLASTCGGLDDVAEIAAAFAEMIRRFVRFAARHPELNQIMVHEATRRAIVSRG